MAKILEKNEKNTEITNENELMLLYGKKTIDGFIGGSLVEKQNMFNEFIQKIEENCKTKSGKEVINILPQTIKTIKKYAEELAQNMETTEQKKLFLRFAETKGSRCLTGLKRYSEEKIDEYKRNQILTYCAFLIKSSKELYDDPSALSENTAYYAGYLQTLEEFYGLDTSKIAIEAIYSAAIGAALENSDCECARVYLNDKNIAKSMQEETYISLENATKYTEEKNIQNAIIGRFNPQSQAELKRDTENIKNAAKNGVLSSENIEEITKNIGVIFNVNMKNKRAKENDNHEKETLALISKILAANLTPTDIINSNLPDDIKKMINRVIETENMPNSKKLREQKLGAETKLIMAAKNSEILCVADIAENGENYLDTAGLLKTIKAIKERKNELFGF